MTIEIRPTRSDEARAVADAVSTALLFPRMSDEEWLDREISWTESDSQSAWDDGRCVGHAGAFRLDTTVPGGLRLATTGVTRVGVLPTHTRRGLLRTMMEQLLVDAQARGDVLASLRASEAVIYRRFGFGIAGEAANAEVTARSAGPIAAPAAGQVRLLAKDEILSTVPDLYDRCARRRVGTISRPQFFWTRYLRDAITNDKPSFVAAHANAAGTLDGFVHYDVRWRDGAGGSPETGTGEVQDLFGVDAAVERALWAYLLDIDLVLDWSAAESPIDDPIRFAMANSRAYRLRERWDEQWLRLLDVDAALTARRYQACDRVVVVRTDDPLFARNAGTWRIGSDGATRTSAPPDLIVAIDTLSAAYLGGTTWRDLADAGRIEVCRDDAVDDADSLFLQRPAPFCGSFF